MFGYLHGVLLHAELCQINIARASVREHCNCCRMVQLCYILVLSHKVFMLPVF